MGFNKLPDYNNNINSKFKKRWFQGIYEIKNVDKYIGDPTKCVYRSSWEFNFMKWCDLNPKIKRWSSEFITIPYQDEKGKYHRYYPDFYLEIEDDKDSNKYEKIVIEIKPYNETVYPTKPEKITAKTLESYEYQLKTFQKNIYKWDKAKKWCEDNQMKFYIITEKFLKSKNII